MMVSRKRVERCKQCRRTVAPIVMGLRGRQSGTERQDGRGSIERLNTALFINAQNDCVDGRVHVKSHHVSKLQCEIRLSTALKRAHAVGLQIMCDENPLDRATSNPGIASQRPRCPVCCVWSGRGHHRLRHLFDGPIGDDLPPSRSLKVRDNAFDPEAGESFTNLHYAVARNTHPPRNFRMRQTFGRIQNDLCTYDGSLRCRRSPRQFNQNSTVLGTNGKTRCGAIRHAPILLRQCAISKAFNGSGH